MADRVIAAHPREEVEARMGIEPVDQLLAERAVLVARHPNAPVAPPLRAGIGVIERIPVCDTADPADLEAWHGPFGWVETFRKSVLASCREIARARAIAAGEKLSEAKIDDLARVSDLYLDFAIQCLNGRRLREQNVRDSITR